MTRVSLHSTGSYSVEGPIEVHGVLGQAPHRLDGFEVNAHHGAMP